MRNISSIGRSAKPFPYEGKQVTLMEENDTNDIIDAIKMVHNKYASHYVGEPDVLKFWRGNAKDTAKLIYDFLDYYIKYKVEPPDFQTVKTPGRLLRQLHGDCKHYATFTCGVVDALRKKGYPISCKYRFVSDVPGVDVHHVFAVVTDAAGNEYWVDPVPNITRFDQRPKFHNVKDFSMAQIGKIYLLSGTDGSGAEMGSIFTKLFRSPGDIKTMLNRHGYDISQFHDKRSLVNTLAMLVKKERPHVGFIPGGHYPEPLYTNPSGYVKHSPPMVGGGMSDGSYDGSIGGGMSDGSFDGSIGISFKKNPVKQFKAAIKKVQHGMEVNKANFKHGMQVNKANLKHGMDVNAANAKKGIKAAGNVVLKVGLLPARKAFLSLVALNVRGLATQLAKAVNSPDRARLEKIWTKDLQGEMKVLLQAIHNGGNRKRIGHCHQIGVVTIAAIGTWVALAGAVIAALAPLLKNHGQTAADSADLATMGQDGAAQTISNAYKAADIIDANTDPTAMVQETPQTKAILQREAAALQEFSSPTPETGRMAIKPGVTDQGEPEITIDDIDHPVTRAAASGTNPDGTPIVPKKGGGILDDFQNVLTDAWDNHKPIVFGITAVGLGLAYAGSRRRGKK